VLAHLIVRFSPYSFALGSTNSNPPRRGTVTVEHCTRIDDLLQLYLKFTPRHSHFGSPKSETQPKSKDARQTGNLEIGGRSSMYSATSAYHLYPLAPSSLFITDASLFFPRTLAPNGRQRPSHEFEPHC